MSVITIELELPEDWQRFQMPKALARRLHTLLDEQDRNGKLSKSKREEVKALMKLVDWLCQLQTQAHLAGR